MASTPRARIIPQRKTTTRTRTRIEVQLVAKPRDYVPGSGPALQPLSLLPKRDSTAYITERILQPSPGLAVDGRPLPKRMTYIVGFRDLPAARVSVPAAQILDYVSPYELESWEWWKEGQVECERAKLEAERVNGVEAEMTATGKRKRGRPKGHSQIESALVVEAESLANPTERPKAGAMSLSTPQKVRSERFNEAVVDSSTDDMSPSRQLEWENQQSISGPGQAVLEADVLEHESESDVVSTDPSITQPMATSSTSAAGLPNEQIRTTREITSNSESRQGGRGRPQRNGRIEAYFNPKTPIAAKLEAANGTKASSVSATPAAQTPDTDSIPARKRLRKQLKQSDEVAPQLPETQAPDQRSSVEEVEIDVPTEGVGWDVERVEAMEVYEVEGKGLVRYFKVRWEGEWPPDQNPTWEPEENLTPKLVKTFMKNRRRNEVTRAKIALKVPEYTPPHNMDEIAKVAAAAVRGFFGGTDGTDREDEASPTQAKQQEVFMVE